MNAPKADVTNDDDYEETAGDPNLRPGAWLLTELGFITGSNLPDSEDDAEDMTEPAEPV